MLDFLNEAWENAKTANEQVHAYNQGPLSRDSQSRTKLDASQMLPYALSLELRSYLENKTKQEIKKVRKKLRDQLQDVTDNDYGFSKLIPLDQYEFKKVFDEKKIRNKLCVTLTNEVIEKAEAESKLDALIIKPWKDCAEEDEDEDEEVLQETGFETLSQKNQQLLIDRGFLALDHLKGD